MTSPKLIMLLAVLGTLVASCHCTHVVDSAPAQKDAEGWAVAAIVGGSNPGAYNRVHEVLSSRGIQCYMEGSVGYAIMVPQRRLTEAKEVLSKDEELRGLLLFPPYGDVKGSDKRQ